jgi:hypothetical protein
VITGPASGRNPSHTGAAGAGDGLAAGALDTGVVAAGEPLAVCGPGARSLRRHAGASTKATQAIDAISAR